MSQQRSGKGRAGEPKRGGTSSPVPRGPVTPPVRTGATGTKGGASTAKRDRASSSVARPPAVTSPAGLSGVHAPSRRPGRDRAAGRKEASTPVGIVVFGVVGVVGLVFAVMIALDTRPPGTVDLPSIDSIKSGPVQLEQIKEIAVERDTGDAERKRRELEAGLLEAEKFAQARLEDKDPARFTEVLARWRTLREHAMGTHYAAYVQTKIDRVAESLDAAAVEYHNHEIGWILGDANAGDWETCFQRFDRYPPAFRESSVWPEVRALRTAYEERRRAWERVTVRAVADFGAPSPKYEGLRLLAQQDTVLQQNTLKLVANNRSTVAFGFPLSQVPKPLYLRVTHLSSVHKGRFLSPVTITINDRVLVGDWTPSELNYITTIWDISGYVKTGENAIVWQLGDARTLYWLKKVEISDWLP